MHFDISYAAGMPQALRKRDAPSAGGCCPRPGSLTAKGTRGFSGLFKALADETRLEIVGLLAAQGKELCVCEIESHFDLGQSTVSHHLRILRDAGLVSAERRGTWVYYALEREAVQRLAAFVGLV